MKAIQCLVVHNGDEDIKQMLLEHSITMHKPTPPNDVSTTRIVSDGFEWLVMRFFHPGDSGYTAFGLPLTIPPEDRAETWRFILNTGAEAAAENGIDMWAQAEYVELPPLHVN